MPLSGDVLLRFRDGSNQMKFILIDEIDLS